MLKFCGAKQKTRKVQGGCRITGSGSLNQMAPWRVIKVNSVEAA